MIKSCFGLFGSINIYGISARIAEKCSYVNKIVIVLWGKFFRGLEVLSSPFSGGNKGMSSILADQECPHI
jgi:hypothetical protein